MRYFLVPFLIGCQQPASEPLDAPDPPETELTSSLSVPESDTTDDTDTTDPTACPPGVICVDALPYNDRNSTTGAASVLDSYGCDPGTDESGPEVVYRIEVAEEGLFVASLSDLAADVDVDVHLLEELDSGACVDRGHWDAAALLDAGTWWVVVDSWVDSDGGVHDGDYTLDLAQTGYADHAGDGLDPAVLETALWAFDQAWQDGETARLDYGIIDYTLPSTSPRFFVLDLRVGALRFAELTTHGSGSQDPNAIEMAAGLSNVPDSNASSMGLVRAAETYWGSNGYSMRMDGLEPGYNDNDRARAIVVHGADYATQDFIDTYGYLGRSWGCPAVDPAVNELIIDTLSDGALILKYAADPVWLATSHYAP